MSRRDLLSAPYIRRLTPKQLSFLLGAQGRIQKLRARRNPGEVNNVVRLMTVREFIFNTRIWQQLQTLLLIPGKQDVYSASLGVLLSKYEPKGSTFDRKTEATWHDIFKKEVKVQEGLDKSASDSGGMTKAKRIGKKMTSAESLSVDKQSVLFGSTTQEPFADSGTIHSFWLFMDGNADPEEGPLQGSLDQNEKEALMLAFYRILEEGSEEDLAKARDFLRREGTHLKVQAEHVASVSEQRLKRLARAQRLMQGPVLARSREPVMGSEGYRSEDIEYVTHVPVERLRAAVSRFISRKSAGKVRAGTGSGFRPV